MIKKILKELYFEQDKNDYTRGDDVSNNLNVTTRTLRNYIKKINNTMSNYVQVQSKATKGYKLIIKNENWLRDYLDSSTLDTKEMRVFIIYKLLYKEKLNMFQLSEKLYLSESVVFKLIFNLKVLCENRLTAITILKDDEGRYCLLGNEFALRSMYIKLSYVEKNLKNDEEIDIYYYNGAHKDFCLLNNLILQENILTKTQAKIISLRLLSMIARYKYKSLNIEDKIQSFQQYCDIKFSIFADVIFDYITINIIILNENEKDYILNQILMFRTPTIINYKQEIEIKNVLKEVNLQYELELERDPYFQNRIIKHINNLIYMLKSYSYIYRGILNETKKNYEYEYNIAINLSKKLEVIFSVRIHEEEIALLAIHIAASQVRINNKDEFNIIIISNNGYESQILYMAINKDFKGYLGNLIICESEKEAEIYLIQDRRPSLIISDAELILNWNCKVIKSIDYNDETKGKIGDLIKNSNNFKTIKKFLYGEIVILKDKNINLAIKKLALTMRNDTAFYQNIIEREKKYSTYIGNSILMPHEINVTDYGDSKIMLGITKSSINSFDGNKVNIIFMLSFSKKDNKELRNVMTAINKLRDNKNFIERIIKNPDINILEEILK